MGVASSNILDVHVHFFGDVKVSDKSLEELDIRAWLDVPPAPPELEQGTIDPIALLPPLLATSTLYLNAKAAPHFIDPLTGLLFHAPGQCLESEKAAREYGSEPDEFKWVHIPMPDQGLLDTSFDRFDIPVPTAIPESEGNSSRKARLSLMQTRSNAKYWGRSRAPGRGGQALFANSALVLVLKHIARTRDYERAVVPMAAALAGFNNMVELAEEHLEIDEAGWRAMGKRVYEFNDLIQAVALADDPRQELKESIEDSDPADD